MSVATRRNRDFGGGYEPTQRDIQRACERIQATWSPRERAKRRGQRLTGRWSPPLVSLTDINLGEDAFMDDTEKLFVEGAHKER